jgi:phycocyanobilin lyase subunit alpha
MVMTINLKGVGLSLADAIDAMESEDSSARYYAAWYLGHLKSPESVDVLIWALQDDRDRTELGGYPLRRRAAEALGRIGDLRAVSPLIEALDCPDIYVRDAVVWALGELGDLEAISALLGLLKIETEQPYETLIEALGRLAQKAKSEPSLDDASLLTEIESTIRTYLDHHTERVRCAAARTLYVFTGEDQYGQLIMDSLGHPDVHVRRAAAFDLAEIAYFPAASAIAKADITNNLKVHTLKRMVDLSPDKDPDALEGVLAVIATLI